MCGISGVCVRRDLSPDSVVPAVKLMRQRIVHRGPDGHGIYVSSCERTAFAHTRLSIIDLTEAGSQPMSTPDGRFWITFNGEIYNYRKLRAGLVADGVQFNSDSDTEVVLRLYERLGAGCLDQLRGMFVFAVWDDVEKSCFLARDPFGIKPLYVCESDRELVFASEVRAILASGRVPKRLNHSAAVGYLMTGSVPEGLTLVDGVRCLEAGTWMRWENGKTTSERYWTTEFTESNIDSRHAEDQLRAALVDSVRAHMVSDVPVALFLSGGVDSSALAALAVQEGDQELHTFSIGFEDKRWDESSGARLVASTFGTVHHSHLLTESVAKQWFDSYLDSVDQPSVDGFNVFCVARVTSDAGFKVALSGVGSDELFAGYPSFERIPRMLAAGRVLKHSKTLRTVAKAALGLSYSNKARRLQDYIDAPTTFSSCYYAARGVFSRIEAGVIAEVLLGGSAPTHPWLPAPVPEQPTPEDQVSVGELTLYMRNQLLRDCDNMTMAWGLEVRLPFVDRTFFETVAAIPSGTRLEKGKALLKRTMSELPEPILSQRKRGFTPPLEVWLDDAWFASVSSIDPSSLGKVRLDSWYRKWTVACLDLWIRKHLI